MIITTFGALLLPTVALAQAGDYSQFVGTWSTGSKNVTTGPQFANPAQLTFIYPSVSGISFSFSIENTMSHYEIARYRFISNGTEPNCIKGVLGWVHGTWEIMPNNSIVMTPFGDGYQQIQDPCGAISNFIENYNETELYQTYAFSTDPQSGVQTLQLSQFDGALLPPLEQVSSTPDMLPTERLRNVSVAASSNLAIGAGEKTASLDKSGLLIPILVLGLSPILL